MSKWIMEVIELIDFGQFRTLDKKLKEIDELLREAARGTEDENLHDKIMKEIGDGSNT